MTLADVRVSGDTAWPVARLRGEIDLSNVEVVGALLEDCVSNRAQGLVVDLSGLRFLDSTGLRLVFRLARQLGDRQQRLHLVVPDSSRVARLLDIAGVRAVADITPDEPPFLDEQEQRP